MIRLTPVSYVLLCMHNNSTDDIIAHFSRTTTKPIHQSSNCSKMNPDDSKCTSSNEEEIQSSTHQLKQDDYYISIGTDSVKNSPHPRRCQCGPLDQTTCTSNSPDEDSQTILMIMFQDFVSVSSNNWRWEDENSCHFSFADSATFLDDDDHEERAKDESDDSEDEDSILDSIGITVRRRLKHGTMSSSHNK